MKNSLRTLFVVAAVAAVPAIAGAATAQELWTKDCQKCHAADGSASGPMGKKLKIRDYTNPEVNAALTDEVIIAATKDGVKNDAGKMVMPAYGDKYTSEEITALLEFIRSLAKK